MSVPSTEPAFASSRLPFSSCSADFWRNGVCSRIQFEYSWSLYMLLVVISYPESTSSPNRGYIHTLSFEMLSSARVFAHSGPRKPNYRREEWYIIGYVRWRQSTQNLRKILLAFIVFGTASGRHIRAAISLTKCCSDDIRGRGASLVVSDRGRCGRYVQNLQDRIRLWTKFPSVNLFCENCRKGDNGLREPRKDVILAKGGKHRLRAKLRVAPFSILQARALPSVRAGQRL